MSFQKVDGTGFPVDLQRTRLISFIANQLKKGIVLESGYMQIIVGHVMADFDVLGSMVAAGKLFPKAKLVFAGAEERMVKNYLETQPIPQVHFCKPKEINLEDVTELILVDTRYASRIGVFKELLGKPKVKIQAYDHHPLSQGDIEADVLTLREVGSTATLLVQELKKKKIKLTPEEATLVALGIYEDTGSLTYLSTSAEDFDSAAYLLKCGARLVTIPSYLRSDLNVDQMPLFADIIKAMEYFYMDGVQIGISMISAGEYLGDLALFIHKLRDIGQVPAVFILVQLKDRVQVIARSQTRAVDVAQIMNELGGGGHRSAASAIVRNAQAIELKKQLLELLKRYVEPLIRAKDIMSSPVMTVAPETTVEQIRKMILRYRHNAYPVMQGKEIVGVIAAKDIDRAIHLGLNKDPIERYMTREVTTVDILASLHQVRDRMVELDIGFLPVTESGRLVGVITGSDIVKITHQHETNRKEISPVSVPPVAKASLKTENIKMKLESQLPQDILKLLREIGKVGDEIGYPAYVVGGFVRDLLLGVPNYDLDIVVEGDGITFAKRLGKILKGHVKTHKRFNTAIVTTLTHQRIDVATARTEFYEYPAALPQVEASSIKHDLYRRDFSINAMAIKLNQDEFGFLYDFFNGEKDLLKGRIRVLHNLSFVEDPTRIFRAIRFEQRYGFRIDKQTRHGIANAVDLQMFDKLANQRVREEVIQILSENNPWNAIQRMHQLNVLQYIHPQIHVSKELEQLFGNIRQTIAWEKSNEPAENFESWEIYFLGLLDPLDLTQSTEVCHRLIMLNQTEELVRKIKQSNPLKELENPQNHSPSFIYQTLREFRMEGVLYLLAKTQIENTKLAIQKYLLDYRHQSIHSTGKELQQLGIPPGPQYKKILEQLLFARLDGKVSTQEDEIKWVKSFQIGKC